MSYSGPPGSNGSWGGGIVSTTPQRSHRLKETVLYKTISSRHMPGCMSSLVFRIISYADFVRLSNADDGVIVEVMFRGN